jgi:phosphatidylglycerophosphate synthase
LTSSLAVSFCRETLPPITTPSLKMNKQEETYYRMIKFSIMLIVIIFLIELINYLNSSENLRLLFWVFYWIAVITSIVNVIYTIKNRHKLGKELKLKDLKEVKILEE